MEVSEVQCGRLDEGLQRFLGAARVVQALEVDVLAQAGGPG
ncbi:hypothetical protein NKH18_33135 [Streptomyces sp. M10(2022)]